MVVAHNGTVPPGDGRDVGRRFVEGCACDGSIGAVSPTAGEAVGGVPAAESGESGTVNKYEAADVWGFPVPDPGSGASVDAAAGSGEDEREESSGTNRSEETSGDSCPPSQART